MSLNEKVALVTGGSRGIGRAICLRLAELGATVVVNYVSRPDAADETVAIIEKAGGKALTCRFNVADGKEVQDGVKEILANFGQIDILVNNAGITRDGLIAMMKEESWDQVLDTNLKGAYHCIKAVSRSMMKKRWGRIITITSVIGFAGNAGQANYAAAKAGLAGLTRSVARELASRGVTANGVAPGYIDTDMTRGLPEAVTEKILSEIPMSSLGTPEDVAGAVAYLASDEARYVTGQFIHVNGGMFMG
ncbi:MAG: 3-oxoacyl-[acyl-carrier-protein] reductase [Thermodesulfobacteriota bacterium]|nr:3-oxoacyl-[acyl-carrier-protein] reductase [Thermodesulfobacteriota bacterium]